MLLRKVERRASRSEEGVGVNVGRGPEIVLASSHDNRFIVGAGSCTMFSACWRSCKGTRLEVEMAEARATAMSEI